jgi:hypothetical protein
LPINCSKTIVRPYHHGQTMARLGQEDGGVFFEARGVGRI